MEILLGRVNMCSVQNCLQSKVEQCVNMLEMFKIQPNDGPIMSTTSSSFCF